MLIKLVKYVLLSLLIILIGTPIQAKTGGFDSEKDTLLVGLAGSEPFVFEEEGEGIAVEIWSLIAEEESWSFKYIPFESIENALHTLNKGGIDVLVGPISITSKRLETMRFSQPFYNSSISITSREENSTFWQRIKPLFSFKLLMAVFVFLVILAVVGTMLWLAERKESPEQFPTEPLKGMERVCGWLLLP